MESVPLTSELVVRALAELVFVLTVLGYLTLFTDLRQRLFPLGSAALAVLWVVLIAWGGVQMIDRWQYQHPQPVSFIPFARFAMYQAQDPRTVAESYYWHVEFGDDNPGAVNPIDDLLALSSPSLSTRMRVLLAGVQSTGDTAATAEADLRLYAIGLRSIAREDGADLISIEFGRVWGDPADPHQEPLISWSADELEIP
jgi:hypothetical protein